MMAKPVRAPVLSGQRSRSDRIWEGESLPPPASMGRSPAGWLRSAVFCPVLEEHGQVAEGVTRKV